jgi:hypothetical protein
VGIGVLGFPRQDFITNDHDAGGFGHADGIGKDLGIKLTAALKVTALFIRTNQLALLIHELRAADGTEFPPGIPFSPAALFCRDFSLPDAFV